MVILKVVWQALWSSCWAYWIAPSRKACISVRSIFFICGNRSLFESLNAQAEMVVRQIMTVRISLDFTIVLRPFCLEEAWVEDFFVVYFLKERWLVVNI